MTIKEVSEKCGIPADTLRYYEKVGAIPPVARTAGGIRNYTDADIGWVEQAICMRGAGLSVEFLIEYLRLYQQGDETFAARLALLRQQKELLLAQQNERGVGQGVKSCALPREELFVTTKLAAEAKTYQDVAAAQNGKPGAHAGKCGGRF